MTQLLATRKARPSITPEVGPPIPATVELPSPSDPPAPTPKALLEVPAAFLIDYAERVRRQQAAREELERGRKLTIEEIINAACKVLDFTHEDLFSSRRHYRIILGRECITVVARKKTLMSFPEIAKAIGKRNSRGKGSHATVITALQRFERHADEVYEPMWPLRTRREWAKMVLDEAVKA